MAVNEYGVRLDSNGYAPSILQTDAGVCYACTRYTDTARHEVFGGNGRRPKSKRLGLWVNLCPNCHNLAHNNQEVISALKKDAQESAMYVYMWDIPKCIKELGKNYLEE